MAYGQKILRLALTQGLFSLAPSLLLFSLLPNIVTADEYDYYSWQSDNFHNGRFYTKQPQCVDIPADLRLCHNVGYKKMRLPNLLDHETMPEVKQQAGSWVPLLAKRCHADTQVFLCSLFAPVCLDRPIYPCRSLCEAVRDSCAPVMETYGFPWPEMLSCDKFPIDNDLCIPMQFAGNHATQPPGRDQPMHPRTFYNNLTKPPVRFKAQTVDKPAKRDFEQNQVFILKCLIPKGGKNVLQVLYNLWHD